MTAPDRDLIERCRSLPAGPWRGTVWRLHGRRYAPADPGGSLRVSGRYHRGNDFFPEDACWPALYCSFAPEITFAERMRHTSAENVDRYASLRLTEMEVALAAVVDVVALASEDAEFAGLIPALCRRAHGVTQTVAAEARTRGAEGLVVPSCTGLPPGNLVVFVDLLRAGSKLTVVRSVDPSLRT